MNKKAIKSFIVILGLVILGNLIPGCESNQPNLVNPESFEDELNKTAVVDFATIEIHLNKIMQHLCQSPNILTTERIRRAAERHITLSDLQLDDQFVREFQLKDGNTFEVNIELFQGSSENELSTESTPVYFILDPDRFPGASQFVEEAGGATFQANVAATKLNQGKGLYQNPSSQKQLFLSSKSQKVDYLLFFVGGEEVVSPENEERLYQEMLANRPGLAKAQSSQSTIYWWITKLQLKEKKDTTNEEFELYLSYNYGTGYPFQANTNHRFNGGSHVDASGYSRVYPDVNSKSTYTPSHPIAIDDTWYAFQLAAIEDDYTAGSHKNDHHGGGKHNQYMWGKRVTSGYPIEGNYSFYIHDDVTDDDDIYDCSIIGWSGYGNPYEEIEFATTHVSYWLRQGAVWEADNNWLN